MYRPRFMVLLLAATLAVGCQGTAPIGRAPLEQPVTAPLLDGLGTHSMLITTDDPLAQRYFDQGLVLAYGFNHAEAARSFRAAQQLAPNCAICYWGEALVLGPNINAPMNPADNEAAWTALKTARRLATRTAQAPEVGARGPESVIAGREERAGPSAKERALIRALSARYAEAPPEDRSALDRAYADAMRPVAARYPDDPDVQALFAEALMDTTPWDYWEADNSPKPVTEEFTAAIEAALAQDEYHPGANHLYIHAVESVHPEKGIAAAERLDGLVPGAGHLVHMPGHIYIRVGRYHDAVRVNLEAAAADERYIAQCNAQGAVPLGYYPHNLHFLWFAAMMGGEGAVAVEAAEKIDATRTEDMIEVERLRPALVSVLVRFERWDEILAMPAPPEEQLYARAMWHYGRGLAYLHTENGAAADAERAQLTALAESETAQALEQPYFHGLSQIRIARHLLEGARAGAGGEHDAAVAHLQAAVEIQDALPYMEPPYWFYPTRQTLGAALLAAGRFPEAEAIYREDLDFFAENGWSLHGLAQSLRAQGRIDEANNAQWRFERAWTHADATLSSLQ
jgi:tetratricopeptide (TPR) repeat protein